jgi:hypothetical protein
MVKDIQKDDSNTPPSEATLNSSSKGALKVVVA